MKREAVAQHLAIKMETREESVVLHLMGRLDGSGAGEVGCRLEALGRHRAVLDFSRVEAVEPFGARVPERPLPEFGAGIQDKFRLHVKGSQLSLKCPLTPPS